MSIKQKIQGIIKEGLEKLDINIELDKIIIEKRDDEEWVYLYEFYKAEENIAERLLVLNSAKNIKHI